MRKSISEMKLSNAQIKKVIREALAQLPEEDRNLIKALYFENISVSELAKRLKITKSAVRYRKRRALKQLKEIIIKRQ